MIGYLEGRVITRQDERLVVLTSGGVGYEVNVPLTVARDVTRDAESTQLHVTTVVRDNEIALYGFADTGGKQLFQMLLKASGVGPRMALNFLSSFSPPDLVNAILNQDVALLSTIPGVGKKTAAKLCVELSDRLNKDSVSPASAAPSQGELISALTNLGFPEKDVIPVIRQLAGDNLAFSDQIKKALALLGKQSTR